MDVKKICEGMSSAQLQDFIDSLRAYQRTADTVDYKFEVTIRVTEATTRIDDAFDKNTLSDHIAEDLIDSLSRSFSGVTVVSCEAK